MGFLGAWVQALVVLLSVEMFSCGAVMPSAGVLQIFPLRCVEQYIVTSYVQ